MGLTLGWSRPMVQFSFRFVGMGEGVVLVGTGEGAVLVGSFLLSAFFSVTTPHVSYVEERKCAHVWFWR